MGSTEPDRRPRLDDVATAAGVSTATVSLVLRGSPDPASQPAERVLAVGRPPRLPTRSGRQCTGQPSQSADRGGDGHQQPLPHPTRRGRLRGPPNDHGYNILLSTLTRSHNETRAIETLLDSRCEALVLLGTKIPAAADLGALGSNCPLVVVGRPVPSAAGVMSFEPTINAGLDQAVAVPRQPRPSSDHLRRRWPGTVPTLRRRAYQRAMRRHHLADHIQIIQGGQTEGAGAGPPAASCWNDLCQLPS